MGNRGIASIIAALLLIAIAVTAGVMFYTFSTNLLGSLVGQNSPATMDSLRFEAYNWRSLSSLIVNVRNIGSNVLTMTTAYWFVGGVLQNGGSGCAGTLSPGTLCTETIPLSSTPSAGIVYVVKIVLRDGSIFSSSAIAGQVTGQ